ncbi:MAG: hypothetical protein OXI43_20090 [Candidatus Poribacteria bacterium]|nr:hypothetical protein [Candidatus Poribacteria bacterium]
MPYLWTKRQEIQNYLDTEGGIQLDHTDEGDDGFNPRPENVTEETAEQFENEAVFEVATFLSIAFKPDAADDVDTSLYGHTPLGLTSDSPPADAHEDAVQCPAYIRLLVAKYAAAKIAIVRIGSSLGNLPNWVREYENDVFAQLRRLVINANQVGREAGQVQGLVWNEAPIEDILMKMKTRSQAVLEVPD